MAKLGLQLYTVKDAAAKDLIGTIKAVGSMGYEGVEFAGYFDHTPAVLRDTVAQAGMACAATHILLDEIEADTDRVVAETTELGCPTVICPFIKRDQRTSVADWRKIASRMNDTGRRLADAGLRFLYHHHNFDFDPIEGTTGMEILLANLDRSVVGFELDVYWVEATGNSALEFYNAHHAMIPSIHFKNMKDRESKVDTEIRSGVLDLGAIATSAITHGAQWLVVEQEKFDMDPMESARVNLQHLRELVEAAS